MARTGSQQNVSLQNAELRPWVDQKAAAMARKIEFMLADSFEVTGEWWLPDNPAEKLYGTLCYSPTNIELERSGTLDEVTAGHLMAGSPKFKDHPCIHGLTHDRQEFTLLRAHASSLSTTTKYNAFHIGVHAEEGLR